MPRLLVLAVLALTLLLAPAAAAAPVPEGAVYEERFIDDGKGPRLHADVLRPKGLPAGARTPVILTVSPYTNHSATGEGPGGLYDPEAEGPSSRFYDLLEQGRVFERGYTYVMVDLRGFGGSAGCNDWGGPGEQADVRRAVEWAAAQEFSTGKVGLYGKSYDAWTGLMGIAQRPQGLGAVVAQEPVVDGYRYLYMNRVPFPNRTGTPAIFQVYDATPGAPSDTPTYLLNGTNPDPSCYAANVAQQQDPDPRSAYWKARNLVDAVKGATVPTFLTQGFLETNTKPDAVFDLYASLAGPKRAWLGQFDHVRGTDADADGRPAMGRRGFADEVMRFFGEHLRGEAPAQRDPAIAVQSFDGTWRAEEQWPPADARPAAWTLNAGTYTDTGGNRGTGEDERTGVWTFSPPLDRDVHLAGPPRLDLDVDVARPEANLVANLYDVAPDGTATMISRGALLVAADGPQRLELYGQDWRVPAGHRLGVLVSSSNDEWWDHLPNQGDVTVERAVLALPLLERRRAADLDGGPTERLEQFREDAPFTVDAATVAGAERAFPAAAAAPAPGASPAGDRPAAPAAGERPATPAGGSPATAASATAPAATRTTARTTRLTARLGAFRGRRLVVAGTVPRAGATVVVRLVRGGRTVATKRLRPTGRRYRAQFRVRRAGAYRAVVTTDGRRTTTSARRIGGR